MLNMITNGLMYLLFTDRKINASSAAVQQPSAGQSSGEVELEIQQLSYQPCNDSQTILSYIVSQPPL